MAEFSDESTSPSSRFQAGFPVFFLSLSFVGPVMQYTRCVRVVSVLAGVFVLLNVHRAAQFLQLRYHIYIISFVTINNSKLRQLFICYLLMTIRPKSL